MRTALVTGGAGFIGSHLVDGLVEHGPPRPGDVRRHLADMRKARAAFGYAPTVPLAEGIRRTVSWYAGTPRPA